MQMCHIVPGQNTKLIQGRVFALCLAQFVLSDDEYARTYRNLASHTHVIMDNGLAEEGAPLKVADLVIAMKRCEPDEVVLPDYLNPEDNARAACYALHEAEEFLAVVDEFDVRVMYVPHGNSLAEYASNITDLARFDRLPDSFGISKFHDQMHPLAHLFGRAPLAMLVKAYFPNKPLHYLGLGGPVSEISRLPFGRSCDTCYAFMSAAHGIPLEPYMLHRPKQVDYQHNATLDLQRERIYWGNVGVLDALASTAGMAEC